jgi:hypothetical protein
MSDPGTGSQGELRVMMDLIFVLTTLAFFLISIAYVFACDRLR